MGSCRLTTKIIYNFWIYEFPLQSNLGMEIFWNVTIYSEFDRESGLVLKPKRRRSLKFILEGSWVQGPCVPVSYRKPRISWTLRFFYSWIKPLMAWCAESQIPSRRPLAFIEFTYSFVCDASMIEWWVLRCYWSLCLLKKYPEAEEACLLFYDDIDCCLVERVGIKTQTIFINISLQQYPGLVTNSLESNIQYSIRNSVLRVSNFSIHSDSFHQIKNYG